MTIRVRILALLGALAVMAASEAVLVVYLQRLSQVGSPGTELEFAL